MRSAVRIAVFVCSAAGHGLWGQTGWQSSGTTIYSSPADAKVGIGTSTPAQNLVVQGSSTIGVPTFLQLTSPAINGQVGMQFTNPYFGTWATKLIGNGSGEYGISFNDYARLVITTDGKVGIRSSPAEALSIVPPASISPVGFYDSGGVLQGQIWTGSGATARQLLLNLPGASAAGDNWSAFRFGGAANKIFLGDTGSAAWIQANHTLSFNVGNAAIPNGGVTPHMVLNSAGNLGIGTASPATRLDVAGQVRSSSGGFVFPDGTTQTTAASGTGSQWVNGSGGVISYTGGNVGVGTASPATKFDVAGQIRSSSGGFMFPDGTTQTTAAGGSQWGSGSGGVISYTGGSVGIGTASPISALHVRSTGGSNGVTIDSVTNPFLSYRNNGALKSYVALATAPSQFSPTALENDLVLRTDDSTNGNILFATQGGTLEAMRVTRAGNVGIGTTSPEYKLSVNGTIKTKEVLVTNNGWADYVFRPSYRLKPLTEVAAHIREHHRLPDIPSEQEVQQKGVGLAEMQVKLLAKIEELTLHMIQAEERSNRLEQQNRELQSRLVRLERGGTDGPKDE